MKSTLPSRWQEILRREAAENVGTVLAQAREQPSARRFPRWAVPALVVGAASVSLFGVLGGNASTEKGRVPFDRSTVISTRTAGLGASAEDLAPHPPHAASVAPPEMPAAPGPPQSRPPRRPALQTGRSATACPECDKRRAALARLGSVEVLQEQEPSSLPPARPVPAPLQAVTPSPLTINLGTRVEAVLTDPIVTGAAFAPASATLAKDVYVGDRLAIPAGTVLIGEGFATDEDDRAQVQFSAIVRDGKTIKFEGWALQQGEMGIRAKVIRKGSKTKKGAGTVLGAAASALTYGLAGAAAGPEGAALASLGQTAASDMSGLGRDWRRSNKVVRVEAGAPITIYIRRDLAIE